MDQFGSTSAKDAHAKFLLDKENYRQLSFGRSEQFLGGLEAYIGRPKNPNIFDGMRDEHIASATSSVEFQPPNNQMLVTTPADEWMFVMDPDSYVRMALPGRRVERIEFFISHEISVKADLTEAEVVAARLYTGPMYAKYNTVLRNPASCGDEKYMYTIHAISSCIIKLSRFHKIANLYRGIKGHVLPPSFLECDEYGTRGGLDTGFMSTTTNRDVAVHYSGLVQGGSSLAAVVFEIDEGAIDRGADVSWLSQFPYENEVLFPPLTYLEVMGDPKVEENAIVAKLRVNINLRSKTVNEVVEKARTQYLDMLDWYLEEVQTYDFGRGFDGKQIHATEVYPDWLVEFTAFKNLMHTIEGPRFNQQQFYRKAVDDALDLKEGTSQKVRVLKLLKSLDLNDFTKTKTVIENTIRRLQETTAAKFANPEFVKRFVEYVHGYKDAEGNTMLANYSVLWTLPMETGSWTKLIRAPTAVPPIRISTNISLGQCLRNVALWFSFIRVMAGEFMGYEGIDTLRGFTGVYYYIGLTKEGDKWYPFYQLSSDEKTLACKYLYYKNRRWYVGSNLGSDIADVRSSAEDIERSEDVLHWEKTSAPVMLKYVMQVQWLSDSTTRIHRVGMNQGAGVVGSDAEACISGINLNSLWLHADDSRGSHSQFPALTHDAEKWAFVHRIIEEQVAQAEVGSSSATNNATNNLESALQATAERHSIAVYCEQTGCPRPKEVSRCLLQEGQVARMVAWIMLASVGLTSVIVINYFWLMALENLNHHYNPATYEALTWYSRGMVFSYAVPVFIFMTIFPLFLHKGCNFTTLAWICFVATALALICAWIWYIGESSANSILRTLLAFGLLLSAYGAFFFSLVFLAVR